MIEQHSTTQSDEPPGHAQKQARPWLVAIVANMQAEGHSEGEPEDAGAEYDRPETIQAIRQSIESDGHTTIFLNADVTLWDTLRQAKPDICFNIAEGLHGDAREAHIPAILEMLAIPYTASRVMANAIALDKTMTKRIWRDHGLPVGFFQEFENGDEALPADATFPLFVKPAREGSGMGVTKDSVVYNETDLRRQVKWVIETYHQPALVETFLSGREFTVGTLGRADARNCTPLPHLYAADGFHRMPIMEINTACMVTPGMYSHEAKAQGLGWSGPPGWLCPAEIEPALAGELQEIALKAHQALGAVDISRVDFRLDDAGKPTLLEINLLPGLNPMSDFILQARAEGLEYRQLILEILYLGASRYGLVPSR